VYLVLRADQVTPLWPAAEQPLASVIQKLERHRGVGAFDGAYHAPERDVIALHAHQRELACSRLHRRFLLAPPAGWTTALAGTTVRRFFPTTDGRKIFSRA
jgi:hypothetical protein